MRVGRSGGVVAVRTGRVVGNSGLGAALGVTQAESAARHSSRTRDNVTDGRMAALPHASAAGAEALVV
jgi:hypothetical protein